MAKGPDHDCQVIGAPVLVWHGCRSDRGGIRVGKLSASLGLQITGITELISFDMPLKQRWPDPSVLDGGQASGVGESTRAR